MKKIVKFDFEIPDDQVSVIQLITKNGSVYRGSLIQSIDQYYEMKYKIHHMKALEGLWNIQTYRDDIQNSVYVENISIDLSNCYLNDEYLEKILQCWRKEEFRTILNKLIKINVMNNKITNQGYYELIQFINEKCPNVKELITNISKVDYTQLKPYLSTQMKIAWG